MNKYFYIFFLLFSVFISAFSQILLKKAAQQKYKSLLREYLNLKVILAYFLFFLAVLIDLLCLKYVPLSFIPVIETSSYVFIILFSKIFFNEHYSFIKILGLLFIIIGILIYVI